MESSDYHPVGRSLEICCIAARDNGNLLFKHHRNIILEYLKPQYQCIAKGMDRLNQWIKDSKFFGGFLAPGNDHPWGKFKIDDAFEHILTLEDIIPLFQRDVTPTIRRIQRRFSWLIEPQYARLPRETAMKACVRALSIENYDSYVKHWKEVASDLDRQYLEIRGARWGVFSSDREGTDVGCRLDLRYDARCEELFNFEVLEPEIRPLTFTKYLR